MKQKTINLIKCFHERVHSKLTSYLGSHRTILGSNCMMMKPEGSKRASYANDSSIGANTSCAHMFVFAPIDESFAG